MDCVTFFKHITLDYELGCGFFLFRNFNQVFELLGLCFLCAFGLKVLYSDRFSNALIRPLCGLGVKHFCCGKISVLKFAIEELHVPSIGEIKLKSEEKISGNFDVDFESDGECNESDVSRLRSIVRIERQRAKMAREEVAKEREASASAAEEAMAMILRLQNEKSCIEMELSQYRRLAEKKQIHDLEVIQSLKWLVRKHESDNRVLQEQLKLYSQDESDEEHGSKIWADLENVLYSSLEANLSPGVSRFYK